MKKKLIEVSIPLEAINVASAREKSIRHGHPSTLHLWWARRPLAACRAVLFASLVDDPSSLPEEFPTEEAQEKERMRLFGIIEELVKWENSNNERVLEAARKEILKSTDGNPPPVLDPFCGGGSIPLEAQRLGLEAHASDLNPVAVLITKALIEIPPKFAGKSPVNPETRKKMGTVWKGAQGLAEDVRYYGQWMRDEAEKRIGHLYPKVKLKDGKQATVIAWLWARTVKCPNPACGTQMPLVRSFDLSTKKGREWHVEPLVDHESKSVEFEVKKGKSKRSGTKVRGKSTCLVCEASVTDAQLRDSSVNGGIGVQLMTVVAEGDRGRTYLSPSDEHAVELDSPDTAWLEQSMPENPRWFSPPMYGLNTYRDLFTPRQLVALTTFSDLVGEARERVLADSKKVMDDDAVGIADGGTGATAYADALATYLAFALSKASSRSCTLAIWEKGMNRLAGAFGRQAIAMTWDYAETNPLAGAGGDIAGTAKSVSEVVDNLGFGLGGQVRQLDSRSLDGPPEFMIATDPPYYDNIGYADLSDFFYVWLRRCLSVTYPVETSTLLVPKAQELVASPYRFDGDKAKAKDFFEVGMTAAFERMRAIATTGYPLTLYYAFKQSEVESLSDGVASTGWETMLEGLLQSGLAITGTWPIRSELTGALKKDVGALASSIVLVCRHRNGDERLATRREFIGALKAYLPEALRTLQHGNIAPVDLAQAAIGPGMAVFSRYSKVVESDGSAMTVRTALQLINQVLDEVLAEQESEYDADTRWAVDWFSEMGMKEGEYGRAEVLSTAKNVAVQGLVDAGILASGKGKVRLLRREELDANWDPATDTRLTVWEVAQYLIRALEEGGEKAAADLVRKVGGMADIARDLAYRLFTICEHKKWADEALAYNALVVAWPEVKRLAAGEKKDESGQAKMFE